MSKIRKLTAQQNLFVSEYLKDLNATQAAARAGYSEKNASTLGYQLLQIPRVQYEITQGLKAREARTQITQDKVLHELARIAFLDLAKIYDEDGRIKCPKDMEEEVRRAIGGLDLTEQFHRGEKVGETTKVRFNDKLRALELIGKHLGMFVDRIGDPDGKPLACPVVLIPSNGSEKKKP